MADDAVPRVRVELLGPLQLLVDGAPVEVPGTRRRAVLVLLAVAQGRLVSADHLVDALWPVTAPGSGRQALQTHVSRLRRHLGPASARLQTRPDGYRLDLDRADLDLAQARALLARSRGSLQHDPADAYAAAQEADRLWRGPVLADLGDLAAVALVVEECARLRSEVMDALVAGGVAAGRAEEVLATADRTLAADPLREPAALLLMRALAATGQAAEALRVGREHRQRLADETGLDPSPALAALERDIAGGVASSARAAAQPAPRPVTPLVGRERQVASLHRLLASQRLVTVVGPGGVGKTRVAFEVAGGRDGALVLPLAPLRDATAIPHALAAALDLQVTRGDVLAACTALIGAHDLLLVVDNCEHLLDAVRDTVTALLSACPRLKVLATSREPLGMADEYTSRLPPLPVPARPDAQDLGAVPSVALFLDRARRVRRGLGASGEDLHAVAEIVRRLDGMPLAIELAAGRLSTFSLADLRDRLDRSLDLLGGGQHSADARHRTLRATLEWSHRLLTHDEQRLFRHLAVFVDGADLDAVERLATDLGLAADPGTALARLVDTSMLQATFTGADQARYRMLETIRVFGLDRLTAAGEIDSATSWLVRWAVDLTRWFDRTVTTEREADADATLRRELANLRAAWRAARSRGLVEDAAAIVTSLFDAVMSRDLVEVRAWALELADDPALVGRPHAAAVLGAAAYAAYAAGEQDQAEEYARAGLIEGGDGVPHCRHALAVSALARGAWGEAVEHCLDPQVTADQRHGFHGLAALACAYAGDLDRARAFNQRWLAEATSPSRLAWATYYQAEIEHLAGSHELAEQRYREAITLGRDAGDSFVIGVATIGLSTMRALDGGEQDALAGLRDVIELFARTGYWTHQWIALRNLANLLRRLDDVETAELIEAAAAIAPDAPATPATSIQLATLTPARSPEAVRSPVPVRGRTEILDIARLAIERHLTRPQE